MKPKTKTELREIFEGFDHSLKAQRDERGNYRSAIIHNIWIGFKNWYPIANIRDE